MNIKFHVLANKLIKVKDSLQNKNSFVKYCALKEEYIPVCDIMKGILECTRTAQNIARDLSYILKLTNTVHILMLPHLCSLA